MKREMIEKVPDTLNYFLLSKKEKWSFYYSCNCPKPDGTPSTSPGNGGPRIGPPVYW
jgi:hypothetical protein